MGESIFHKIKSMVFGEPEHEIIRLEEGISECSTCAEKIKGKSIYRIPGEDKHYCKEHAREAMDKNREENFNAVPEALKKKVKFSKADSFYLECADCGKKLIVAQKEWSECEHCNGPICQEHKETHSCKEKQETEHANAEASVPRRCEFCGKKIILETSHKCGDCNKFFCSVHELPAHHECKT